MSLEESFSVPQLLFLGTEHPKDRDVSDYIGSCLNKKFYSPTFFEDVVLIWAKHMLDEGEQQKPELCGELGAELNPEQIRYIAHHILFSREDHKLSGWVPLYYAERQLSTMQRAPLRPESAENCRNFLRIMTRVSKRTKFERSNDSMLILYVKSLLPPDVLARISEFESPVTFASELYEEKLNDLVGPWVNQPIFERFGQKAWSSESGTSAIILSAIIFIELLPCKLDIRVNTEIARPQGGARPALCLFPVFGFVINETLFTYDEQGSCSFPIITVLLQWTRHAAALGDETALSLLCALETPHLVSAVSPFYYYTTG